MDKDFLILIWQNGLFTGGDLHFSTPIQYEVLSPGLRVQGAAVDFVHARLRNVATGEVIGGSVRVDLKSSQWRSQGTVDDPQMSGVVLHLVADRDMALLQCGFPVLTCTLVPNKALMDKRQRMAVGCESYFSQLDPLRREALIERLFVDRLHRKSDEVVQIAHSVGGDWEEVAYICLMRAMGYKEKKQMFERLARSLPLSYLLRHRARPILIEALLLGQAGYLELDDPVDDYTRTLKREFVAMRAENALLPPPLDWSAAGVRVHSMPAISLARASTIICDDESLLDRVINCRSVDELYAVFDMHVGQYWESHYAPGCATEMRGLAGFSAEKINLLVINFVAPLIAAYGEWFNLEEYAHLAIELLEDIPAENNKYTRRWASMDCSLRSAYVSQALIQLSTTYCATSRCSCCPVGTAQLVAANGSNQ